MKRLAFLLALLASACAPEAPAPQPQKDASVSRGGVMQRGEGVRIVEPWAAASPGGATVAAGYLTIANDGDTPQRLVAAACDCAARVEIHDMTMDGAIMRMRPVEGGLVIPAHGAVTLAPEDMHLMFVDVAAPFAAGESVTVTLAFESGETLTALFPIRARGHGH